MKILSRLKNWELVYGLGKQVSECTVDVEGMV